MRYKRISVAFDSVKAGCNCICRAPSFQGLALPALYSFVSDDLGTLRCSHDPHAEYLFQSQHFVGTRIESLDVGKVVRKSGWLTLSEQNTICVYIMVGVDPNEWQ